MEGQSNMTIAFRAHADALGSDRATGRFRSRTSLEEGPELNQLVAQAIARAKTGDQEAFRFLYLRYVDNVYGYVRSIVRDEHEAEDVTQHVFAKLMTTLPKYQQRDVPFTAWILRVARNVAVDHMRARRAVPCEEVRELEPQRESSTTEDDSLALREALATLPEDQRQVIVLRHVVGLTPGEIAGRLGKTEPSIHGLHHRGRGAHRAVLTERDCAPTVQAKLAA
jgi:RNA polymerase sigma-70 factor (ECF subfamily)